ncbi:activating signal cointegrator 1 complex subunit 2 [Aricia agestis]|uniref:activating signal cointegrator 1 complex subunit 2 n=1 Tax=Aricia agestis TaxID=91739 RepID=UPI001C2074D5|nr:activating signal cointegrator 1 complex subunit 2 [Aricia agestis]
MESHTKEFSNPDNLPSESLTLLVSDAGVVRNVNAIDPYWVDKKDLIFYERPPSGSERVFGAIDNWKSKMEPYLEYLQALLQMEHHRFWSTIIYHKQCMDTLISFLQEADPPYVPPHENPDVQKLYEEIRKHILIVFSRLVTNKESKSRWLTKEYMGEIMYERFIFTVPVLWDICLTYGCDNPRHVSRLLQTVFELQPQYRADVMHALAFVKEAFKYIILQVNKTYESEEPPNLPETFKGFGEIKRPTDSKTETISFRTLRDLVLHLLDTAMTLRLFVEVYPESVELFKKTHFVLSIVQLYEYGIPNLCTTLQAVGDKTSIQYTEVEGYIELARAELIDLFKEILAVYKNAIFSGEGNISTTVESYLSAMLEALSERLFVADYHACWPVTDDIDMLKQAYPDIDPVKTDFILQAIYSNIDEPVPEETIANTNPVPNGHVETIDNPGPSKDNEIPDNIKEESLISEVKDILPHLGDGFILKCLKHYGFNAERVINSVLEDTLADSLRALDRNLPIVPEDPLDNHFLETGVQRLNVFDGDEFDIMTRDDVDLTKIHVGKRRDKYKNVSQLLDDKSEVKSRIDIYSKYNLVCDDAAMYSDEYDDTYDSDGAEPPSATADPDEVRRPFVTPRALAQYNRREESDEESSEEEAPKAETSRNRMNFCTNPEELRARRAAAYRPRGHAPRPQQPSRDVIGKPKGQGQEKDVLANRDKKEKHKSSRANHNRRQGAQWKRSQGMMPS